MADNTCVFDGCEKPVKRNGLCNGHSSQFYKGRPLTPLRKYTAQPREDIGPQACEVKGCDKPRGRDRRICGMHAYRLERFGSTEHPNPQPVYATREEAFWARVDKTESCWLWTGAKSTGGYGNFNVAPRTPRVVHRLAYEWLVGPIPDGLVLDHLCRVRHCVNPAHLEPVTNEENLLRGEAPTVVAWRENRCPRGHELTEENTYRRPDNPRRRQCRACIKRRTAEAAERRRAS